MIVLAILALVPLALAIVLARGEPVRTISCLCAMGVGCLIAVHGIAGLMRTRSYGE